jgi:hypothetical protein
MTLYKLKNGKESKLGTFHVHITHWLWRWKGALGVLDWWGMINED